MTDTQVPGLEGNGIRPAPEPAPAPTQPLPTLVHVSTAFSARLPSQRVMDAIARAEPGEGFADLTQAQPFRIVAFRALLRDFPERDAQILWLHSYDVEVEVETEDPTAGRSPTSSRDSAATGA